MSYIPDRGHLVWLSLDPQAGREQAGRRPAVVVSRASYNGRSDLALLCPVTSQSKGYPFEVPLPAGLGPGITGVILADQVRCLDWRARQATFVAELPPAVTGRVLELVGALLAR